ncbi:MAG TPA: amidase [Acidimicrobiales bacterium]|nr:amidase [Acidimicrobiales bacterium]
MAATVNLAAQHDALGLAELVGVGEVSAHELLDQALASIEAVNPTVNAVTTLFEDQARRAIDRGLPDGPFRGVPVAIKDLWTQVAGLTTTNGSRLFASGPPCETDSEVIVRYRRAGLVLTAKTNTPELGLSPTTEPALTGATHNPWDLTLTPGGSSGGAAAAVASGIFALAHASDGGGSIRIPASCCGLFGLKPTRGRVPVGPERGEGWNGMSTQHVVTRSVRDSAAVLDASAGPMAGDPYWAPPGSPSYLTDSGTDPPPLRIGLIVGSPTGVPVDPSCRDAAESTARRAQDLGHEVVPLSWPAITDDFMAARSAIVPANIAVTVDSHLARTGRELAPDDLEPMTRMLVERGRSTTATTYIAAVQAMHRLGRTMGTLFEDIDVLVTPTLAAAPGPLGALDGGDMERFIQTSAAMTAFTYLVNLTGQPAMTLPLDWLPGGIPIGSQVIGRFGGESTLFRLAGQIERAHPWFGHTVSTLSR